MRPSSLFLLIFISIHAFGQEKKLKIENLDVFENPREKTLFAEIQKSDSADFLPLLLLSDNYSGKKIEKQTCLEKVNDFISKQTPSGEKELSAKEIKKLYKAIHDGFLVKYGDNPGFSEIFVNGTYNCATASALYALLLQRMSIPFEIRETPQHVYIVAAPLTYNILFETTAPGASVLQFNEKMKDQYLNYLVNNKIISKEELAKGDKNNLFEKYFYADKAINLQQLVGLLYYNLGIDALQSEKYNQAYRNFEKAYFLYPSQRTKYFASFALGVVVSEAEKQNEEKVFLYYIRAGELGNQQASNELLAQYHRDFSKKLLVEKPDVEKYHRLYSQLMSAIQDSTLIVDIKEDHFLKLGYYYYLKNDLQTSNIFLDSLYWMNQENLETRKLLGENIQSIITNSTDTKKAIDSIEFYRQKYPFLKDNLKLAEYNAYCLAKEVAYSYEMKEDHKNGLKYFNRLHEFLKSNPSIYTRYEEYIVGAYALVSSYYVRKQDYKAAREVLISIDKYLPENEEINRRLKHVEKMIDQLKVK